MGDILSQNEIDALLTATAPDPLRGLLIKLGVDKKKVADLYQRLAGQIRGGRPAADVVKATVEQVRALLRDAQPSERQMTTLTKQITAMVGKIQKAEQPEQASPPVITPYDFKHPARVNKNQLRALENLHDNFARLLSSTLSGAMRAVVDVDTAFVDQTTYAEFIMSLSNPSCSYQFALGPTNGLAIIDFAMPVVFAAVDRTFGGKGSSQGVNARQLSQVEMSVMAQIMRRTAEDLEATWEPILKVELSDIELETNPEFMQITAASEIVLLLAFEVNSTHASGLVSLCYPFFTLESILPRLGQQTYVRQGRQNREETIRQNNMRLANTEVPLRAELGAGTLTVGEARRLAVGDVCVLDTRSHEPAVIYVGDEPKLRGLPFGRAGTRLQVKVSEVLDAAEAERLKGRCRPVLPLPW